MTKKEMENEIEELKKSIAILAEVNENTLKMVGMILAVDMKQLEVSQNICQAVFEEYGIDIGEELEKKGYLS